MSYYDLLGVDENASQAAIKSAYRRLVKQYHPDRGESGDIARFREIQEAYETLSDGERRRRYDASRVGAATSVSGPSGPPVSPVSPVSWTGGFEEPIPPFREVSHPMSFGLGAGFQDLDREPDLGLPDAEIVIGRRRAATGGEMSVDVARETPCPHCGGARFGFFGWCDACGGAGWLRSFERARFVLPAGVASGEVVTARLQDGARLHARVRVVPSR